jgi:hypothetical protein
MQRPSERVVLISLADRAQPSHDGPPRAFEAVSTIVLTKGHRVTIIVFIVLTKIVQVSRQPDHSLYYAFL